MKRELTKPSHIEVAHGINLEEQSDKTQRCQRFDGSFGRAGNIKRQGVGIAMSGSV